MTIFVPLADIESVRSILSRISLFGAVQEEKQTELFRWLETACFKKGDYIFRKGDEPTHIYMIKRGKVDLQVTDNDVVVDKVKLEVGESFGEASLMSMHQHTATAVAIEDCEIIVLSRHALIQLQHKDIELFALLMMNIARELARRLKLTDDILLHYLHAQGKSRRWEK
jgi:CRP-like cAMP-binding protein